MSKLGVFGSIAFDNIFSADHAPVCGERVWGRLLGKFMGGMAANQSLEAVRYLKGVEIIGKVGNDQEGVALAANLASRGVGTSHLLIDEKEATGQSYMYLVGDEYFSIVTPGANQAIQPEEAIGAVEALGSGALMASLEVSLPAVLAALNRARELNIDTVLIPSPAEVCTPKLLAAADTLIMNRREAYLLLGLKALSIIESQEEITLLDISCRQLVVTFGKAGAILRKDGQVYYSPGMPVQEVDAVGAGDAFSGAFVSAKILGYPPAQALAIGCIAGGLSVSMLGSQTSEHGLEEVLNLYNAYYV